VRDLFARFTRSREDEETEAREAEICDANLAQLKMTDPDARQIFVIPFAGAWRSACTQDRLAEQIAAYAQAKALAGRLDLYDALFAGL
jgi:hypothetical protein